ncbi:MAG: cysteine desulfurase [Candidatus Saganbacteria bacterium]|uniref:Cysteine desulfurase n=1 Tax=Candidatus Saganbacteria bacterium TaxID=2575572 RepID=A0A833NRM0_UNCSA|nr:MAG: cysteine desulfurase [Candidatus Saganbacteria bacterium]
MDYAATTPTHPDVLAEMQPYFFLKFGNPSSIHQFGQEAKAAIETAREKTAKLIGASADEIVFTSGGTESDNFAIEGIAFANEKKGKHIITSKIEHHAVSECCEFLAKRGFTITHIPVDKFGLVDPEDVKKTITDKTILISIMHANNEIGTIEPIAEIAGIAKEKGVYFHTDAVQTAGHIPINKLNADLISFSAHKFYGPKGIGALYIKKGTRMVSFLHGGAQEKNRRASTENVPGIVGMGKACELAQNDMAIEKETILRDKLIKGLFDQIPEIVLNGHPTLRLPNNVNISIKHIEGESILINLDLMGIAASSGSACTSGSLDPSHVLMAIGLAHEVAHGSLRLTLGKYTTDDDIIYLLETLPPIVKKLRAMSPLK